ncbi:hypothetical protein CTRI78_v000364 [Colletotrichum trifolii]|uniref:Uncharacterized protein n=1 Tax=Colletotrichum trifolii TaxID=5466 RepID=A0A4R8RSG8_COLTR|nr:hypothetical protein CTRI78_v000364 [Colletotrichum trifolii]
MAIAEPWSPSFDVPLTADVFTNRQIGTRIQKRTTHFEDGGGPGRVEDETDNRESDRMEAGDEEGEMQQGWGYTVLRATERDAVGRSENVDGRDARDETDDVIAYSEENTTAAYDDWDDKDREQPGLTCLMDLSDGGAAENEPLSVLLRRYRSQQMASRLSVRLALLPGQLND